MSTVLLAWELGRGLGHLVRLSPLASTLAQRGHRVFLAVKDLARAQTVFDRERTAFLQAPVFSGPIKDEITTPMTFAHILHNVGFCDRATLMNLADGWRNLLHLIKPDLVVFDHSPTALLASRGLPLKRIIIGSGFFCPPDQHPLPNLRRWIKPDPDKLRRDEDAVLENMNHALKSLGEPPLDRITQMYAEVDDTFLTTFAELDHYSGRQNGRYWGAWTKVQGAAPVWPEGTGKRIYAYLKAFPQLPELLNLLTHLGHRTLIVPDGIDPRIQDRFQSSKLRFIRQPLDLQQVGRDCDLAILNGNHGTTISLLMSGRPTFQLPLTLEQVLFSEAVERVGAGLHAPITRPPLVAQRLETMLISNGRFAEAAQQFARRYATFDPAAQRERMTVRLSELLPT